ncbi:Crp/Fnr family transcriptional regulator [Lachnoclostridium sp. An196]|uniref:Crp/Fnr family transcriptional regulator n=1 Tax=Lachnoclostridium sp. An196 TaxID=1965583 RepID=UPI000B3763F0|nr:Crp/Fnr family transcriptional regulator [Lachnoclostridium sp. An196]OUP19384.1 Crp/Fnr family transcriptional regulator [Lachnoclostridium sp. An196]
MKNYIPILKKTVLFSGVKESEIEFMLSCLQAKKYHFKKGEFVLSQGQRLDNLLILLDGKLYIQQDDYWGNRSILNVVNPGEMFGESYAAPESGFVMNDVMAVEDSDVIFFDVKKILTVCSSACRFHTAVVENLVYAISERNRSLVQKLGYMSKRTTREKLIAYLSDEAKRQSSNRFSVPFNRQQMADFLSVDRSAMSNELSKMKNEGLIDFQKNHFILL